MRKFIGVVVIGLICCLVFVTLWKGKNSEGNEGEINDQYQYEPYKDTSYPQDLKNPKGNWVQVDEGWRYRYEDRAFVTDTWVFLDGERYHFDKDGWMQVGWIEVDGNNYYLNENGVMLHDTFTPDGYYLNGDGIQTDDELIVGDGITYMVDTDPRGQDSYWDMYYCDIPTFNHYILRKGQIFEGSKNVLTPEMLYKINMDAVEKNSIILNYKNYKDGYCLQENYIVYDEKRKKAIVIGQYEKSVYQNIEKCIGTHLKREYDLETGELIKETEDQLK